MMIVMNGHLQHGQSLPSSLLVHLQHKVIWEHVGNEYGRKGGFQKRAGCYRGTRKKIPTFAFLRNHNAIERGLSVQKAVIPESGVQRRNVLLDVYTAMTERQETQKTLQRDECAASPKPSSSPCREQYRLFGIPWKTVQEAQRGLGESSNKEVLGGERQHNREEASELDSGSVCTSKWHSMYLQLWCVIHLPIDINLAK